MKELTLTLIFQILFPIFVGVEGVLHRVCNKNIRKMWIECFALIGSKSRLASVISSTKASSAGPGACELLGRSTSGISMLLYKRDEYSSAIHNAYCQQRYQSSMGGSVVIYAWRWFQLV